MKKISSGIQRLSLSSFRSHKALDLKIEPYSVIITGENGSGKTNLLEALSLFSPGRGLRRCALSEIQAHDENEKPWAVSSTLFQKKIHVQKHSFEQLCFFVEKQVCTV